MLDEKIYNYKIIHNLEQLTDEEKIKAFLLGYECCPRFYTCDCSCSTYFSNEEDFEPIFKLMNEYNLSTKDVMTLYITYLKKEIHQYTKLHKKTDFVNMLESAFSKFICEELDDYPQYWTRKFTENDKIGEHELAKLIKSTKCKSVDEFCQKYNLSRFDFITLSKTEFHKAFWYNKHFGSSDNLIPDLKQTLDNCLGEDEVKALQNKTKKK